MEQKKEIIIRAQLLAQGQVLAYLLAQMASTQGVALDTLHDAFVTSSIKLIRSQDEVSEEMKAAFETEMTRELDGIFSNASVYSQGIAQK